MHPAQSFPSLLSAQPLLDAIIGRPEFRVIHRPEGFFAVDYLYANGPHTFGSLLSDDPQERELTGLLREARGVKFDLNGQLLGRPYHKFFGMGQMPETQPNAIDWTQPHIILDKLDGSMIHPIMPQGQVLLCTRKGVGDVAPPAQDFAHRRSGLPYEAFCRDLLGIGLSPIFEWCTRLNTIVIDHPEDRLVLTGVRHHADGSYASYLAMCQMAGDYKIPVVDVLASDVGPVDVFLDNIRRLIGAEGAIARFHDGRMLKFKSEDYLRRHGAKASVEREGYVLEAILSGHDDDVLSALDEPSAQEALRVYAEVVRRGLQGLTDRVVALVQAGRAATQGLDDRGARKAFAQQVQQADVLLRAPAFLVWTGTDPYAAVVQMVQRATTQQAGIDLMRPVWGGGHWKDFYRPSVMEA